MHLTLEIICSVMVIAVTHGKCTIDIYKVVAYKVVQTMNREIFL